MIDYSRHILSSYDAALLALEDDVIRMASLCERNLLNSRGGLLNRDMELCHLTIANDGEIDQMEKRVDKNGMDILRRFQPVASDLRHIVAAMKLSGNLERIGDKAVSIARKARVLNESPIAPEVNMLDPMYAEVMAMLNDCMRAYAESDAELAITIPARDRTLDALNHEMTERLTAVMSGSPGNIMVYLDLILIARHLERAGDYLRAIAEDIVYAIAAEDIRHMGGRRPLSPAGDAAGGEEVLAS